MQAAAAGATAAAKIEMVTGTTAAFRVVPFNLNRRAGVAFFRSHFLSEHMDHAANPAHKNMATVRGCRTRFMHQQE